MFGGSDRQLRPALLDVCWRRVCDVRPPEISGDRRIRRPPRPDLLGRRRHQLSRVEAWALSGLRASLRRTPSSFINNAKGQPAQSATNATASSIDISLGQPPRSRTYDLARIVDRCAEHNGAAQTATRLSLVGCICAEETASDTQAEA